MAGIGTRATATDFNAIQAVVSNVMGLGSGTTGYGQGISSSLVSANQVITQAQWDSLRADMEKARIHQIGGTIDNTSTTAGSPWTTLLDVTSSTVISEAIRNQYDDFANNGIAAAANRFLLNAANSTPNVTVTTTTRGPGANWGQTSGSTPASLSHTITFTFAGYTSGSLTVTAADHARCFFNAGGVLIVRASRTGAAANTKDTDWTNMLSGFGDFSLRANGCSISGTLNATTPAFTFPSSTGYNTMSSTSGSPTEFVRQGSSVTKYAENRYILTGYKTATQVIFTVTFQDNDTGDQTGVGPGVDEAVTGTLTSQTANTRPSGSNVDVPAPTASATAFA